MNFSIILKSQLEGADRLDAEYYQPEYLRLVEKLNICNPVVLNQKIQYLTDGTHQTPAYVDEGIPFLSSGNIDEFYVSFDEVKFIGKQEHAKLSHCQPEGLDLLISKSGRIGTVGIVPVGLKRGGFNIYEGIALLRIKPEENPYYIAAFLNSKYGQFQIDRRLKGISQPHIHLEEIREILIPDMQESVNDIEGIIKVALSRIVESKDLYKQAENLLLKELGLLDFKPGEDLWSVVNFSDVQSFDRTDADFFQPKYEKLIVRLKDKTLKPFTEVVESVAAKFSPKPDENYKYVELSNINSSTGLIDGASDILGKDAPSRAKRVLRAGNVIVSSIEGSLGKVALVSKDEENSLASTGFFQFRSKDILPEVLLVFAKSIVLQLQMKRYCAGTILTAVPNDALNQMFIPILPNEIQDKIVELVKRSHDARKKSKELLEEAKRKVEEMIEKSGAN